MTLITRSRRQRGFSIVELMVAVTISIIMFAVIIELFASNKQAYRLQEGASALNESARYAVSHLQYFLRLADHWGGVQPENVSVDAGVSLPLATDCDGDGVVAVVGFRGYEGGSTSPLTCVADANYVANTDMFFIRYGAGHDTGHTMTDASLPFPPNGMPMAPSVPPVAPINAAYINGAGGAGLWVRTVVGRRAVLFESTGLDSLPGDVYSSADPDPLNTTNYRFQAMLYFIRPCQNPASGSSATECDADDDAIPTLVRMTLNPDLSFTAQEVVAGVESMQLRYGVDINADFVADRYDDAATIDSNDNWEQVVAVRVSLVVLNPERDNTVDDTATYYLEDTTWIPPDDARHFRRSQFDFTVQIRNATRS